MQAERTAASGKEDYVMFASSVCDAVSINATMVNWRGHLRAMAQCVRVNSADAETAHLSVCVNGTLLDPMISATYAHRAHCPGHNVHDTVHRGVVRQPPECGHLQRDVAV